MIISRSGGRIGTRNFETSGNGQGEYVMADAVGTELAEQVAVITGAGRGIGRAIALRLAQMGANVMLVGRDANLLEAARAEIIAGGGSVEAIPCDLRSPEAVAVLG